MTRTARNNKDHSLQSLIEPMVLLAIVVCALLYSGLFTADRLTWALEVTPIFIALPLLIITSKTFPLAPLTYRWILVHMLVLIVGGYYTYAKTPLGFWMEDWFGFSRNHFDRIGHLMQGFVPAIITREILLRKTPLCAGKMLCFLTLCVCLAISSFYELLEWWSAVGLGQSADAFLGTQGDPWDTQKDMALALIGAVLSLITTPRFHDRYLSHNKLIHTTPRS